jgi:hypothetical protein
MKAEGAGRKRANRVPHRPRELIVALAFMTAIVVVLVAAVVLWLGT